MYIVSKKVAAENNIPKLTGWLKKTAENVENFHSVFTIERKIVNPTAPEENKLSSKVKANLFVKRLSSHFQDFEATGCIEYEGHEEKDSEHIFRTIVFTYNNATQTGYVDINNEKTDLGSAVLNAGAKILTFFTKGKLAFSLKDILEQRLNPNDEIQKLIHQLLFFGNISIPDTNPWKLPEVFENLSSTVNDPEHDFARFDFDTLTADIKNGFRSSASFRLKNSMLTLKTFNQKQPLHKVDHPDFNVIPYREFSFESPVTYLNLP